MAHDRIEDQFDCDSDGIVFQRPETRAGRMVFVDGRGSVLRPLSCWDTVPYHQVEYRTKTETQRLDGPYTVKVTYFARSHSFDRYATIRVEYKCRFVERDIRHSDLIRFHGDTRSIQNFGEHHIAELKAAVTAYVERNMNGGLVAGSRAWVERKDE